MYSNLPDSFRRMLGSYEYNGARSVFVDTPQISLPFAAVMITDLKLPTEGDPKILEFGGLHARLKGYPGGELAAIERLQTLIASLGLHITVLDGRPKPAHLLDPTVDNGGLIGGYFASGKRFGFEYSTNASPFSGDDEPCSDLNKLEGMVCCVRFEPPPAINPARFLYANPPKFADLLRDKAACSELTDPRFKPRTWPVSTTSPLEAAELALTASPMIEWFVLKPTCLSRGRGITVIHRDDLKRRVQAICIDPAPQVLLNDWPRHLPPSDDPIENWLRFYPLMLEERVSSKPVRGQDGADYDGVMRVCFLVISNSGQTVFVPFCSYWKLPGVSLRDGISTESVVSDIKGAQGTAAVSPDDLARAFQAIPAVTPALIEASTSATERYSYATL